MLVDKDDTALLTLFQNKATRNDGFKGILNKYSHQIYYFLRKMGLEHEDTDELVQDIFIKFWRTADSIEQGNSLKNGLYRLAAKSYAAKNRVVHFKGLTSEQSLIMVLKQQEDFDFAAIAHILSISVNEVRSLFKTGISKLNDQLNIQN